MIGWLTTTGLHSVFAQTTAVKEGMQWTYDWNAPWPLGVTALIVVAAVVFVVFIYLRERSDGGPAIRALLMGIRLALIGLVLLMLYELVQRRHKTDLPDLVVMLDVSQSMGVEDQFEDPTQNSEVARRVEVAGLDAPTRLNLAKSILLAEDAELVKTLGERYRLKFFVVGNAARPLATDEESLPDALRNLESTDTTSRLGKSLRDVLAALRGRPAAAVILLTDGITTEGQTLGEVAEYARRKKTPLHIVAVGNDQPSRDLRLADLLVDEVVFVGDVVNFDFRLTGTGYKDRSVEAILREKESGKKLASKTVQIGEDGQSQVVRLPYRPTKPGDFEYIIEVKPIQGETKTDNNQLASRVRVKDDQIRVLFVQAYPSYEFRYLKTLLARQVRSTPEVMSQPIFLKTILQEADLEYADTDESAQRVFPVRRDELFANDVLIFGDVDPSFLSQSAMQNIVDFVREQGRGVVFWAGPQFTPHAYRDTPLEALFPVELASVAVPDPEQPIRQGFVPRLTPLGLSSPQMQLGETPEETQRKWRQLPELYWLMEAHELKPGARVLAEHPTRTGDDGRKLPVILTQYVGAGRVAFHATDETWRWRFRRGDAEFARYWLQTLRYLSRSQLIGGTRKAEITSDRQAYRRGDVVRLRVRFFDERNAPVEDNGVTVLLERAGSKHRRVKLQRKPTRRGVFEATISHLAEGSYQAWVATPQIESDGPTAAAPPSCAFRVEAPLGERARLMTDTADLRLAAKESRGKIYTLQEMEPGTILRDLPRGRQVRTEPLEPIQLWNSIWVGLAFVVLITAEWLLRKYVGLL